MWVVNTTLFLPPIQSRPFFQMHDDVTSHSRLLRLLHSSKTATLLRKKGVSSHLNIKENRGSLKELSFLLAVGQ